MVDKVQWTTPAQRSQGAAPDGNLIALPAGSRIGKYQIVSVLGQGGFGITYRARDTELDRDVAIKEYLPTSFAARQSDSMVLPHSTQLADDFRWGRDRFLAEAKTLAHLEHATGIVNVYDFLQANGTAYMVMALVPGETLEARLRRDGRLPQPVIERLLYPLLDGLEQVHRAGFLHRDIKPANILIDAQGAPSLIDFGASRMALQDRTQAMTAVYTPGYAAFEQMSAAPQGPWTDIYALAGTLYHCIAGVPPPPALDRMVTDRLVPAVEAGRGSYAPGLLAAIDAGLALKADARPQSIVQWRALFAGAAASPAAMPTDPATRRMDHAPATPRRRAWLWPAIAAVVVLCLAVGGGGYVVLQDRARAERERVELHEKAWAQAKAANTAAAYQDYMNRYPTGSHAAEARQAIATLEQQNKGEEDAWAQARGINTDAGYRAYLDRYPAGRFAADARREVERIEAEAWAQATNANTDGGYQEYLRRYPAGRFVVDARSAAERISRLRTQQPFRDCDHCPQMLAVPRGSFVMGTTPGEEDRVEAPSDSRGASLPQHPVTIGRDFALGRYPVTRGEFAAFVAATGYDAGASCIIVTNGGGYADTQGRNWRNPGFPQTDQHPVVCVSWNDARAYVEWLRKTTGKDYRLPSEAEWEYAARAGTTTARYWGDFAADACRYENVSDKSFVDGLRITKDRNNYFQCSDGYVYTSPVGSFAANPWGFYDMLGNVLQAQSDCHHASYNGAPTDGRSWDDGGDCSKHVVRGGNWAEAAWFARTAARRAGPAGVRVNYAGFRVARGN
ncbi:bifunctional serine/threonine-protein kinase/formylglycine-generating enzyme family protein [Reyranella sp. CPCC 100927]|uniref:bifunctional serine/threonine-protein kinase/formylglycine-generating enzyme family protein n=1 Tax=Reyranella sp. CPCC 100927 TaxID=2599616 RepID=UPI0015B55C7D|nr:bifunctional serine/threonine-protein kinase/formylglycine-generating enzyme family protein [Reyranella sp. CPCC 100927]